MKIRGLIACLGCLGLMPSGFATIIYSNTSNDQSVADVFGDVNMVEIGDQISFAPGPRTLVSAQAQLESFTDAVTADVTLRFYSIVSTAPGVVLASATLPAVSFAPNTRLLLTFTGWNLELPDDVIWTLSLSNATSQQLGVDSYSPPTIGSSSPNFVWWGNGTSFFQVSSGGGADDYFLSVDATVPEPTTLWMGLAGGLALGVFRLRTRYKF